MRYKKKPISAILRSPKTVFTFKDVSLIWGGNDKKAVIDAVNYYIRAGALYRIRRGIYAKDARYDKLELATRIFTPSYVSFETVLTEAGINFQFYRRITVASYQTREIMVEDQTYSYKKIKNTVLTNPAGIRHAAGTSVACPERAFLDTLYIHKEYHFDNMNPLNWDKVFELLPMYTNKRMAKKVSEFFTHYNAEK